jgi:multidrug resistance efflux pump
MIMLAILSACRSQQDRWQYGVVESRRVETGSKAGGRVIEVAATEGTIVGPGTILVRFDTAELRTRRDFALARIVEAEARREQLRRGLRAEEIEQAEAAARQARSQLEALRNGPRREEIEQARADLRSLEAELRLAGVQKARVEALFRTGDVPRQALDEISSREDSLRQRRAGLAERAGLLEAGTRREDIAAAEQRVIQMEKAAAVARAGSRKEEIAQAEARIVQMKADLTQIDVQLAEAEVKAPSRCRVEAIGVRPGDLVPAGRPVVTLLEEDQTWVRVYVPAVELGAWPVGAVVEVTIEGAAVPLMAGKVEQVAAQAEFLPRNVQTREDRTHQVFAVKIRLDGGTVVRSGMSAAVRLAK